ncbi:MAG: hydroxysqualene dehydroxylase HpnE [Thermoleophilia bacterium]
MTRSQPLHVVVIGGGLAGLAAAVDLVDAGARVTVLEARPTLGGAVQTLPEREGDPPPPPDNGQHVALGCCTEYLRFLDRIGESASVSRVPLSMPVIDEEGRTVVLGAGPLALLRYSHLSVVERVKVGLVAQRLGRLDPAAHDHETFGEVLRRLGTSSRAIDRFWDVFVRPALNVRTDEASAALGIFTVRTALLGPRSGSDLVIPTAPLGAMHGDAAGRTLAAAGATVRLRARVTELDERAAVLADGERIPGDAFVVALGPTDAATLLGEPDPELGESPIVSVHLLFDRQILRPPLAALLDSPAHWLFDRGRLTGHAPPRGQYVTVVSSGVPDLMEERGKGVVTVIAEAVVERLGHAELLWSRVSREPRATFLGVPGTASRRPGVATARPNVARAGTWTATGWPATMEGAIRSGRTAARHLLGTAA